MLWSTTPTARLFGGTTATPGSATTIAFPTSTAGSFDPGALSPAVNFSVISGAGVAVSNASSLQFSNLNSITTGTATATFARPSDIVFSGKFPDFSAETDATGLNTLAAYGKDTTGQYRWLFENANGTTTTVYNPVQINGLPVAGNFFGDSGTGDGLGIFTGSQWYLYSLNLVNGAPSVQLVNTVNWPASGLPVVGDFDGDGLPDLATYNANTGTFSVAFGSDGYASIGATATIQFPGVRARPVAADVDGSVNSTTGDNIDSLGVWVPDLNGTPSTTKPADWYFLEADDVPLAGRTAAFNVAHYQFGSSIGEPFTGLFSSATSGLTTTAASPAITVAAAPNMAMASKLVTVAKPVKVSTLKPVVVSLASTKQSFSGTAGNDVFKLSPGKSPGTWDLSVDGVVKDTNAELTSLNLSGLGGTNTIDITGFGKGETAEVYSNHLVFVSGNLTVAATSFTNISLKGGRNRLGCSARCGRCQHFCIKGWSGYPLGHRLR